MTISQARATSHLLTVADLDAEQLIALLDLAGQMKRHPLAWRGVLDGRSVACCFAKPSTRTRVSFEAAIFRLGGLPIMLRPDELELGGGEPISDTARVLSSYCDAIVVRTFAQSDVAMLARHASVPVINALTDEHHPCQALADCLTLQERFGTLDGLEVAYVGEDNNVSTSLREAAALTGIDLRIATPPDDPRTAVKGAHAVYTDVWMPHAKRRRAPLEPCRVTPELMALAAPDAVFLHCLPAHRGEEVDAVVIDGPQSLVWEQAANRLPTEQALLHALVTGEWEA
jgi:ornithine carbamoyltransferase